MSVSSYTEANAKTAEECAVACFAGAQRGMSDQDIAAQVAQIGGLEEQRGYSR